MVLLETSSHLLFFPSAVNFSCLRNLDLSLIVGLWDAHTMMWLTLHSEWEHVLLIIHQKAFLKEYFEKKNQITLLVFHNLMMGFLAIKACIVLCQEINLLNICTMM